MNSAEKRQKFILEQIERQGSVNVVDLAAVLGVSDMTIRRDLKELEKVGIIRRTHGGAVSGRGRSFEPPLSLRSVENQPVKQMLGKYAAGMAVEGDSIAFDVGSTIYEVVTNLRDIHNVTIVTPSIPIASLFFDRSDVRLILPGGIVRPGETSLVGDFARRTLEMLFVDRLFLGVAALDSQAGLTEYNLDDTAIKQVMLKNAKEVILVADSSKFEKIAFAFVAPFSILHHLVTDEEPPSELLAALKKCGVSVHVVQESGVRVI